MPTAAIEGMILWHRFLHTVVCGGFRKLSS